MTEHNMNPHLPSLSQERIDQMVHLATSYAQEKRPLPFFQRLRDAIDRQSRAFVYGFSASAVTVSCLLAFWLVPAATTLAPAKAPAMTPEFGVSDYIMQDFLEDIS